MSTIFGLLGLVLMLAICVGAIFLIIFLGRKLGYIAPKALATRRIEGGDERGEFDASLFDSQLNLKENKILRYVLVGFLVALLSIPLATVKDVVSERYSLYSSVQNDIAQTWGQTQYIHGPLLVIPYSEKFDVEEFITNSDGTETKKNKTIYKSWSAIVLPDSLNLEAKVNQRDKKRGIYSSLVYQADLEITGSFQIPDFSNLSKDIYEIHWEQAWLTLGVSDTQAINKVSSLSWGEKQNQFEFEPGARVTNLIKNGFHTPLVDDDFIALSEGEGAQHDFSLSININGSNSLNFSPFGKTTIAKVVSDWPHPSFIGDFLPDNHDVSADGFIANWSIPHLARNYPQFWTLAKDEYSIDKFTAGVSLFESVSLYSKITRAVKYGLLFILLTYATFLIFEMGVGRSLHVVQYGVVGFALTLFYLILLSTAEHAGFIKAYFIAASAIVSMIGVYVWMALHSFSKASVVVLMLSGLYFLLFVMLRLEDFALLVGVGLLVCILAIIMYFTRNLNINTDTE